MLFTNVTSDNNVFQERGNIVHEIKKLNAWFIFNTQLFCALLDYVVLYMELYIIKQTDVKGTTVEMNCIRT